MDYSFNSLETIEKYLNQLPKDILEQQYNLIVLRVGAYVGEVIKQQINSDFHWYDYKTAIKLNSEIEKWGKRIDTVAVLHSRKQSQMIFPLAKVCKFIKDGLEDSLMFFATVMIERSQA